MVSEYEAARQEAAATTPKGLQAFEAYKASEPRRQGDWNAAKLALQAAAEWHSRAIGLSVRDREGNTTHHRDELERINVARRELQRLLPKVR